jgi:hypothetical protein
MNRIRRMKRFPSKYELIDAERSGSFMDLRDLHGRSEPSGSRIN